MNLKWKNSKNSGATYSTLIIDDNKLWLYRVSSGKYTGAKRTFNVVHVAE